MMRGCSLRWPTIAIVLGVLPPPLAAAEPGSDVEFFEKKIRPVLVQQCYGCHSSTAKKLRGGLLLDSRDGVRNGGDTGPALVAGKAAESLLLKALRYDELKMP